MSNSLQSASWGNLLWIIPGANQATVQKNLKGLFPTVHRHLHKATPWLVDQHLLEMAPSAKTSTCNWPPKMSQSRMTIATGAIIRLKRSLHGPPLSHAISDPITSWMCKTLQSSNISSCARNPPSNLENRLIEAFKLLAFLEVVPRPCNIASLSFPNFLRRKPKPGVIFGLTHICFSLHTWSEDTPKSALFKFVLTIPSCSFLLLDIHCSPPFERPKLSWQHLPRNFAVALKLPLQRPLHPGSVQFHHLKNAFPARWWTKVNLYL